MPLLKIIFRGIFRNKTRSLLTVCAVAVAIIIFGVMRTFIGAWFAGVDAASVHRLFTRNSISIIFSLPVFYKDRIRCIDGVQQVSYGNWFGGIYISEKNMFANFCVEGASFLDLYPEFIIEPRQRADFLADKKGAVVGKKNFREIRLEDRRHDSLEKPDLRGKLGIQHQGGLSRQG